MAAQTEGEHSSPQPSAVASDVALRIQDEEALAQQKRLYEAILTNVPDLTYVFDLNHRFIYANEGQLKVWGKTWDEAIGRNCLELGYEPWHAAMHDREIDQVVATKQPIRGEVPFTGPLGRREYDYLFVPVLDARGRVEAVAGTTRDITERKRMEASLREGDRRKDEFLATLAHELRNPLAPIRNAVHLLMTTNTTDARVRTAREIIDRQVTHMVRLVDDLMDVSRITLGQVSLRYERTNLRDILTDAVDTASPLIEAGHHELTVNLPTDTILIDGDMTRLSQVFQNLLNNAAKYTPSGGRITLRAERRGREAMVSVRDTGIGIPKEAQMRVFDLFTRIHSNDPIKSSGLGIGLALAKQLIELHNGRIELESDGAGSGSEFLVFLPIVTAAPASAQKTAVTGASTTSSTEKRVLVVDDNRDSARSLAMLLEISGYTVDVTFDGPEALKMFEATLPDIVLLDIGMPGMDGYEVARRIRSTAHGSATLLIALTGWGQAEDKRRAAEAGFDHHLTKPVDLELLDSLLVTRQ
jgi:PAS domain S-box-containing protein